MDATVPEASYYSPLGDSVLRCELCPNLCRIAPGRTGQCRVRRNDSGTLRLPFYGRLSSVAVDPIEKKPLYHFHPGSTILSVGFVGCSLHCPFCQNHTISQGTDAPTRFYAPRDLVDTALESGSFGIAYTYSEPLVHYEYVLECCRLAHRAGLKNVLVTNGYLNEVPTRELLEHVDAANVDLKSFDADWYRRELGGRLADVQRFISLAAGRIALEVTTLIIPGANDDPAETEGITKWLASLGVPIPYHLSCYYPQYRYTAPPTPPDLVLRLAEVARKHLPYVYVGNVGMREISTTCPSCGAVLIRRAGYTTRIEGIRDGVCAACGHDPGIPGLG